MPPSHRDLDTSVVLVKNLLQNEPSRARSSSQLRVDEQVSSLLNYSLFSSSAPGAGGRQDSTVYMHTDEELVGSYYTPRSRHLHRSTVRTSSDHDYPAPDLIDMKRQPENTARTLILLFRKTTAYMIHHLFSMTRSLISMTRSLRVQAQAFRV